MRSKLLLLVCSLFFAAACSESKTPRHQTVLPEQSDVVVKVEEDPSVVQFGSKQQGIDQIIANGGDANYSEALKLISEELFAPNAVMADVYTTPNYVGYITLYVRLFKKWEQSEDKSSAFYSEFKTSLAKFKTWFLDSCASPELSECAIVDDSLSQEAGSVAITVYLASQEQDIAKKLALLGVSYDIKGNRAETKLSQMYIETVLALIELNKKGQSPISEKQYRQHSINVMNLLIVKPLSEVDPNDVKMFKALEAWKFTAPASDAIDFLRHDMLTLIPVYAKKDAEIAQKVQERNLEMLSEMTKDSFDLSTYPAYESTKIDDLKKASPMALYLLLNVYKQNIQTTEAGAFLANLPDRAQAIEEVYQLSRILVRWDIAQLSIKSTKALNAMFSEQAVKTQSFVQDVLDRSKNLTPEWTNFHYNRLTPLKKFVEVNIKYSKQTPVKEAKEFYFSINRNILKTAVYPNMFGFLYHMAKTEWKAKLQILWFTFTLDTLMIFDYLFTGQYKDPWFSFTDLQQTSGWTPDTQTTLLRSEIMDSFYYFFATKSHLEYGIKADEFITTVGETLLKPRIRAIDALIQVQDDIYLTEGTAADQFINWCKGLPLRSASELIHFYRLHETITPYFESIRMNPQNTDVSLFFNDAYRNAVYPVSTKSSETNDRFKLEIMPIMHVISQMIGVSQRLGQKSPDIVAGGLTESLAYEKYLARVKKAYWGSQISIMNRFGNCNLDAAKEAKRRSFSVAFAEKAYMAQVVYPLMNKVVKNEMTADAANQMLASLFPRPEAFLDRIVNNNNGTASYTGTALGFMLRVRQYLTAGLKAENEAFGSIDIPAIVGSRLSIAIPADLIEDENNPFLNPRVENERFIQFVQDMDVNEFSRAAAAKFTDELRVTPINDKISRWDQWEITEYLRPEAQRVEMLVQLYQLGEIEHYDFLNPACRN